MWLRFFENAFLSYRAPSSWIFVVRAFFLWFLLGVRAWAASSLAHGAVGF